MNIINLKCLFYLILLFNIVYCPPVLPIKQENDLDDEFKSILGSLDYATYLNNVLNELKNDADFNKNLIDMNDTNAIADGLKYVSQKVRSKLDEVKRIEIERLNKLQSELKRRTVDNSGGLEMPIPPKKTIDISHIDDMAPDSFNPEDLKRLIEKTSSFFDQIDKRDEETYKYHEMEKKAAKRAELQSISNSDVRKEQERKWLEEETQRRSKHKPIHNPGSIEHLKTVWKEDDHLDEDSFNTKSFFLMHDINNDGNLDIAELETLMQRELDKAYDPNNHDTDMIERYHEMTRMRNKFLSDVDKDNNHLISFDEYNNWVSSDKFKSQEEWKTREEFQPDFSDDEFEQFYKDYVGRHPDIYQPSIHKLSTKSP